MKDSVRITNKKINGVTQCRNANKCEIGISVFITLLGSDKYRGALR